MNEMAVTCISFRPISVFESAWQAKWKYMLITMGYLLTPSALRSYEYSWLSRTKCSINRCVTLQHLVIYGCILSVIYYITLLDRQYLFSINTIGIQVMYYCGAHAILLSVLQNIYVWRLPLKFQVNHCRGSHHEKKSREKLVKLQVIGGEMCIDSVLICTLI